MRNPSDRMRSDLIKVPAFSALDPSVILSDSFGIPIGEIIRLNGNENPFGPSPRVKAVLGEFEGYHIYPDPQQRHARKVLARYTGIDASGIVIGNGCDELIDLLSRMYLNPLDSVIEPTPTFAMYAFSAQLCGGRVISVERDSAFDLNLSKIKASIDSNTKLIWIASPNNPTGNCVRSDQLESLLTLGPLVIVDETYYEFSGVTFSSLLRNHKNLVILRSLSKWAGLAGLRIGYGLMQPELATNMLRLKSPYNVSVAAELALEVSIEERDLIYDQLRTIINERDRLSRQLGKIKGITVYPSQANFILCELPDGKGKQVYMGLAQRGIFVRYFGVDRLQDFIRITVGLPHQHEQLLKAIRSCLEELS